MWFIWIAVIDLINFGGNMMTKISIGLGTKETQGGAEGLAVRWHRGRIAPQKHLCSNIWAGYNRPKTIALFSSRAIAREEWQVNLCCPGYFIWDPIHRGAIASQAFRFDINVKLRPDKPLLNAFGYEGCADQSVIQDTLDVCVEENVIQLEQAIFQIFAQQNRSQALLFDALVESREVTIAEGFRRFTVG